MSRSGVSLMAPPVEQDVWTVAPFEAHLAGEVRQLVARLDGPQRLWLSGYLAGSLLSSQPASPQRQDAGTPVLVLYGSQSGNAERLAGDVATALRQEGVPATTMDMADCRKTELASAETVLVVVSTQGDGDPPDRAAAFWELLASRKAPSLGHVRYSVLALGDSSYARFCETGRQFDQKLQELGARRLHDRVDCDVDFEEPARTWTRGLLEKLAKEGAKVAAAVPLPNAAATPVSNAYTRKNPYQAQVLVNQRLTVQGSSKDVRHIELSLSGSHIRYEPGDAIGVVARNSDEAIDELLDVLPFGGESLLSQDSQDVPLREALASRFELGLVTPTFLKRYAEATQAPGLIESGTLTDAQWSKLASGKDLVDIVARYPPTNLDAATFASLLPPLAPRLYSIASSLRAAPDEAHLTVSITEFQSRGRTRNGVASGMLSALTAEDAMAAVYVHRNTGFRLPAPDVPIVMIGPGTGIAPFRAFLAEREALGAAGKNWLFFGDRCFETDFLYQAEWLAWRKQGVLTRLDVAFSRDQEEKIYVQHRLRERGAELWAWLAEGAHVYVCGDAASMAPDVHAALIEIIQQHGGRSEDQALEYVADLRRDRRYQRDVY